MVCGKARGAKKLQWFSITKPIVCRIDGNNAIEGRRILDESGIALIERVETMDDAARRVAQLAAGK
jgi:succinyl-CoA synthetase beta subunit